jgi:hypothetical protein
LRCTKRKKPHKISGYFIIWRWHRNSLIRSHSYYVTIIRKVKVKLKSHGSSVGIPTGYRLEDRGSGFRFSAGARNFSVLHRVRTGSGVYSASYIAGTGDIFPRSKAAGAWSWTLTS